MHILIVDDDPDIREMLAALLEDDGYTVTQCANGREALNYLRAVAVPPCTVLLDLMMPICDGWQFRSEQLADQAIATVPVVLLSAIGNLQQEVGRLHPAAFLAKPVDINELLNTIAGFCH